MSRLDYWLRDLVQLSEQLLAFGLVIGGLYALLLLFSWIYSWGKK